MVRRPSKKPLARKPKQLTAEPTVFEASFGRRNGELALVSVPQRNGDTTGPRGSGETVLSEDAATVVDLDDGVRDDPAARAAACAIAAQLWIRRIPEEASVRAGGGLLQTVRYRGGSDEIDLERTIELMLEPPIEMGDDIAVRESLRERRAVVLAVDLSGSMREERTRTAVATVGALATALSRDDLAVLTFWSDAAWLVHLGARLTSRQLLDSVTAIPTRGLTNIALRLELAARELSGHTQTASRVLLLSDCVHNAGPDPRPLAAGLRRLDILLDVAGEHDAELARQLARAGHGRLRRIRGLRDVAPALSDIFAQ